MSDKKEEVVKEIQWALNKFGAQSIIDFERQFPCNSNFKFESEMRVSFISHLPTDERLNPTDRNIEPPYNDVYYCRFESYDKFWKDWGQYKRILKLVAFT